MLCLLKLHKNLLTLEISKTEIDERMNEHMNEKKINIEMKI